MALSDEASSSYRFYSLGIVIRDKDEGSEWIDVTPIEDFPMELGRLSDSDRLKESTISNPGNVSKTAKVQGGSAVRAKWVPISNPNRDNAPDVYRSETVAIYKYADTQDYYWCTLFREPSLRGRERVRISLSNKDAGGDAYDENSSYWVEFDTRHKHIRIHTSDNDGEPTKYDFKIDTKAGTVNFEDQLGNSVFLDSVAGHLEMTTENSITINTKRYVLNATESAKINTPDYHEKVSEVSVTDSPKHTLNSDESLITGKKHRVENMFEATNGYDLSNESGEGESARIVGDVKIKGNIDVEGSIHATGTITDDGGNTNHHSH